ncbi:MAG: YCF48-related protein [Actinomycetota bacterium]
MRFIKRATVFLLTILLSAQICAAQTNWNVNRAKGTGDLVAVFFTSANKGWVAGDAGYLAYTFDGGKNWSKQNIGTTENINEIYFRNDDNGYLVAGKKMFITKDAGQNWQETKIYKASDIRSGTPEFLSIRFADKKRGIVIGSVLNKEERVIDSLVMRTEDGGETWQRVFVPSKKELYHLDFVGSSLCWIVGDDGLILASYNGGVSFQAQKSGTTLDLYNVDFRDENEGYIVGSKGTILRTENGGETWESIKTSYSVTFMRVDFADDKNGVIVGYEGTILRSTDKGRTWTKQVSGTKDHLYGLYFTKKYGWAVGANGVVIQYQK